MSQPLRAEQVLRRALVIWGLGHLAIGDRRGWLLILAQPLAIGALVVLTALFIEGTRWMVVFPGLVLVLVVWLFQALNAYRRAVARGAAAGGELQVALFLPLVVALVTGFWLIGGTSGSPATTLREYVSAWQNGRTEVAQELFTTTVDGAALSQTWTAQLNVLRAQVANAALRFGPTSGIDADQPFNSLRFSEIASTDADVAVVNVEIVRRQRVETVLLGFIPTATQETVVVEQLGTISLRALTVAGPSWLPPLRTGARAWRIESVDLPTASPVGNR